MQPRNNAASEDKQPRRTWVKPEIKSASFDNSQNHYITSHNPTDGSSSYAYIS